ALAIDIKAVGLDSDRNHLGVELTQRLGRHTIARTVGAIDDHAQTLEREILRQGALGELDIAILYAVDAFGAAQVGALRQLLGELGINQCFNLMLEVVVELEAVRAEELDTVVVEGIVRG